MQQWSESHWSPLCYSNDQYQKIPISQLGLTCSCPTCLRPETSFRGRMKLKCSRLSDPDGYIKRLSFVGLAIAGSMPWTLLLWWLVWVSGTQARSQTNASIPGWIWPRGRRMETFLNQNNVLLWRESKQSIWRRWTVWYHFVFITVWTHNSSRTSMMSLRIEMVKVVQSKLLAFWIDCELRKQRVVRITV